MSECLLQGADIASRKNDPASEIQRFCHGDNACNLTHCKHIFDNFIKFITSKNEHKFLRLKPCMIENFQQRLQAAMANGGMSLTTLYRMMNMRQNLTMDCDSEEVGLLRYCEKFWAFLWWNLYSCLLFSISAPWSFWFYMKKNLETLRIVDFIYTNFRRRVLKTSRSPARRMLRLRRRWKKWKRKRSQFRSRLRLQLLLPLPYRWVRLRSLM